MDFRRFLDHAEWFYEEAKSETYQVTQERLIIASILFSWIAMESFVNGMMDDFTALPEQLFTVHERGFLHELQVEFATTGAKAGQFVLTNRSNYKRFDDKLLFLLAKVGLSGKVDKGSHLWQKLNSSKQLRDQLTHPRRVHEVTISASDAQKSLNVCKEVIRLLSQKVWDTEIDL